MNFDRFVACVREKNALMTFAYSTTTLSFRGMMQIEQEAALLDAGAPATVRKANAEKRSSILALAKVPAAPSIPAFVDLLADVNLGLYAAATTALAAQGEGAVEPVLKRLEAEAISEKPDARTLETVGSALVAMNAREQAPRLEALVVRVPAGKHADAVKRSLMSVIGSLRNPQSEGFLLKALTDANLQEAAFAALAHFGSPTGIARVKAALENAKENGNKDLAEKLNHALQEK